jgi:hypothetical protein
LNEATGTPQAYLVTCERQRTVKKMFSQPRIVARATEIVTISKKIFRVDLGSDLGVLVERQMSVIFLLTSLFINSRFQSVATDDRCYP